MRRRRLLAVIAAASLQSVPGRAQDRRIPTIGVLVVEVPGWEKFWRLFRTSMSDLDYVDGQSVRYEFRSDHGEPSRLADLASELVQLNVDLIVTWYTPPAQAAKRATTHIPIVMALAGNPVETGLVESLDRPGGNITGMAGSAAELAGKCMELIREMLPSARRVLALANAADPFSRPFVEYVHNAGALTSFKVDTRMVQGKNDLEAAFDEISKDPPDALIVQPSLPRRRIAELAIAQEIAAVSVINGFVEEGGLMSYAPSEAEIYRRAAAIVDKILKGTKPSHIPVEQPTKFELLINMKTAKAIHLNIPSPLLARADVIIE
jgi:putative tryptophan/tyrosine transport system substrate-binding protein